MDSCKCCFFLEQLVCSFYQKNGGHTPRKLVLKLLAALNDMTSLNVAHASMSLTVCSAFTAAAAPPAVQTSLLPALQRLPHSYRGAQATYRSKMVYFKH